MKPSESSRFAALLAWSEQHGAQLHPALEVYHDDVTKFSLRVRPSLENGLEPGFRAVACPLSTTLSYLNALVDGPVRLASSPSGRTPGTPAFPAQFMESLPPHVIGRFFLIKEYLKGRDSFWAPYIATLPQPEHVSAWALPAFWPEEDIAYLAGTNAHVAIAEIQANVKSEFKQARKALKAAGFPAWQDYTQMLYKWAFCIFTSRSFRPSLVLSEPAKQQMAELLPPGCQLDDFSILQPLFDIANHSMTARYAWDVASDPASCQLVCHDAYQPGEQVYNNYGLKTNSELLLAYGFILPPTPALHNDYVHLRKRDQPEEDGDPSTPGDFLISLRPVTDPSSLAVHPRLASHSAAARAPAKATTAISALPPFAHCEPALVDDLAAALAAASGENLALEREAAEEGLVARVKEMLAGKLWFDYHRLKAVEEGGDGGEYGDGDGDGDGEALPPPGNRNQRLAVEYRQRCKSVLHAALEALMGEGER
ncbi:6591135e-f2e1-40d5-9bc7-21077552061d [Thermothielavioides terrestris]|uniref:SET domain-containing protein n=2 Tax=Thermothielavioides terrestris TaxID=2587410 RepID=G2R604_THETT|nr:uncharacterized protein THITE_2117893 [Thermothielavioides terrestris NRRL 8126]AEO68391.1 hypothetical protein THITE_2117893 [Thermothielavioides terrestris NRRL 8126]SPQ24336.1 6591135e-f2e1-40d5-9bc7-21077552061d [Thermothielavioides terrestris]